MPNYRAIIFDLDDTLINTSEIKSLRKHPWTNCYPRIATNTFPIFDDLLSNLISEKGYLVGIVTNSPRPYASRVLEHHTVDFNDLICYHDCDKRKPFPDPMLKCATNLDVRPEEVISIGDHTNDIMAAKDAGMTAIGVLWGESTERELKLAGADFLVNDPQELITLLSEI
ncbi:HAD family hydrolase [Rossellomorea sp. NS-SX7]|uniref:HAD family hydrolase n=1 Tax=Rossellomorea sp. NS-SX7 TaxID=3463856 RepID=UPI004058A5B4